MLQNLITKIPTMLSIFRQTRDNTRTLSETNRHSTSPLPCSQSNPPSRYAYEQPLGYHLQYSDSSPQTERPSQSTLMAADDEGKYWLWHC